MRDVISLASRNFLQDKAQATAELKKITDMYDVAELRTDKAQAVAELRKFAELHGLPAHIESKAAMRDIISSVQISDDKAQAIAELKKLVNLHDMAKLHELKARSRDIISLGWSTGPKITSEDKLSKA